MMIKKDKCLSCPQLFNLTAYNRIVFCNGKEGNFIDDYDNRQTALNHFQSAATKDGFSSNLCKENSLNLQYSDKDMRTYSIHRAINNKTRNLAPNFPSRIFLFPNYYCNNDCRHCFAGDKTKRKGLSLDEARSMIKDNAKYFNSVHIAGGEPTLFKDLIELIRFCKDLGLRVCLYSNCRKMADLRLAREIVSSGIDLLNVPLHSHIAEVHDYMTQRKESFRETVQGIRNLQRCGFTDIHCMVVVHKKNYQHLYQITRFLSRIKVKTISFESLVYAGKAVDNLNSLGIKVSKVVKDVEAAFDFLIKKNIEFFSTSFPLCLFNRSYWKYLVNQRYALLFTNFPHGDSDNPNKRYKNMGTSLSKKCIDCKLKMFCPGLWFPYYHFFGDDELIPDKDIVLGDILKYICPITIQNFFIRNETAHRQAPGA